MEQDAPDVIQRLEADVRDPDRVVVTIGPESGSALGARTLLLHIAVVAEEGLRTGLPCPSCGDTVREVSFADRSFQYCPTCQTEGRELADRRLSKLIK